MRQYRICKKGFLWILLVLLSALTLVNTATASPVRVLVDPPTIWDPSLVPGTQFSIDITVDDVFKLLSYQFLMFFNPEVIHGVSVEPGPFLSSAGGGPIWYPGVGFNNELGVLYLVIEALPPPPATPPPNIPSGSGVLAIVTFEVVGIGSSPLTLGPETGLINMAGGWQFGDEWCYGWYPEEEYPGGPITWVPYQPWRDSLGHGWFSNEPGPELYVRRRGAHGTSGSWPEWVVGDAGDPQTLYCRILNYGTAMGADVYVEFLVTGGGETTAYTSNMDSIDAAIAKGEPSEVVVSASFTSGQPGKYRVQVVLYFKAGGMTDYAAYSLVEDTFGGEGQSRDIPVSFKTV